MLNDLCHFGATIVHINPLLRELLPDRRSSRTSFVDWDLSRDRDRPMNVACTDVMLPRIVVVLSQGVSSRSQSPTFLDGEGIEQ